MAALLLVALAGAAVYQWIDNGVDNLVQHPGREVEPDSVGWLANAVEVQRSFVDPEQLRSGLEDVRVEIAALVPLRELDSPRADQTMVRFNGHHAVMVAVIQRFEIEPASVDTALLGHAWVTLDAAGWTVRSGSSDVMPTSEPRIEAGGVTWIEATRGPERVTIQGIPSGSDWAVTLEYRPLYDETLTS